MLRPGPFERRRDLWVVAAFTVLLAAPFLGKAYHVDEPYFLNVARHILVDPRHPDGFQEYYNGARVPYAAINAQPVFLDYLLAAGWALTGGRALAMRLLFLPFDAAAACALYLLAASFLAQPLLPVLLVLAGPAYLLNMSLLTAEKWLGLLAFLALYAAARAAEERSPGWERVAAALLAAAMLVKYSAVFLFPAVGCYWLRRGRPASRVAAALALALVPCAAYLGWQWLFEREKLLAIVPMVSAVRPTLAGRLHKLRALLAFTGGLGLAAFVFPAAEAGRWRRPLAASAAAAALLFLPAWDLGPVRPADRALGAVMAWGGLLALWGAWRAWRERRPGSDLWLSWAASVAFLQLAVYWTVTARYVLFLLPPTVFALAAGLEARLERRRYRSVCLAALAATVALSLALGSVDLRYADAQRDLAAQAAALSGAGRRLWFTGQWGLQYYMEKAGARGIDVSAGAWDALEPGDVAVIPTDNVTLRPARPLPVYLRRVAIDDAVPLRLIQTTHGQAAFYAAVWGFLPYAVSRAPVEVFDVLTRR